MIDVLKTLLQRAEVSGAEILHRHDVELWPANVLKNLETAAILRPLALPEEIEYHGCEHKCLIERDFVQHPDDSEAMVCLHQCGLGCGLVVLKPEAFDQWEFSLAGLAGVIKSAIAATGDVVEDVRDRLVSVGFLGDAARTVEVFVARGLQWPDAAKIFADAKRLKAADHPMVLTLSGSPDLSIWPTMKPAHAVLIEHCKPGSTNTLFSLDLSPLLALESIPHPGMDRPAWIRHKEAAIKLREVTDGLSMTNARRMITEAVQRGAFTTNRQTGHRLRINLDSFNTWLLAEQKLNLDEVRDDDGNIVKRRRSRRKTTSPKR